MNAFLQVADQQQNAASKAAERARDRRIAKLVVNSERDAPMVASPSEKAQFEAQQLAKHYARHMADREAGLLAGRHGREVSGLLTILESLTPDSAPLLGYLAKCQWFANADRNTRFEILWLIDTYIVRFRVRNGLAPFDDAIFDEPLTAFLIVRENLRVDAHD